MKPNKIIIGANESAPLFEFDNDNIDAASIGFSTAVDVVGAELSIDVFNATVRYPPDISELFSPADYDGVLTADKMLFATSRTYSDLRSVAYSTPVYYRRDGALIGKYYLRDIDRISRDAYKINAMSAIGILDLQTHFGGLYSGAELEDVVAEIIGNDIPYVVENDVASLPVYGWLKIGTKRDNLHKLLFAMGATIGRNVDGDMAITKLYTSDSPRNVPSDRIYYGGRVDYNALATAAEVTEHTFLQDASSETVVLFDNTDESAVTDLLVTFSDAPVYNLTATGTLTIGQSGVNYAYVSGVGTLSGKKYVHTTHVVSREVQNAVGIERKIKVSEDLTLISAVNSGSVADRILAYYSSGKTVKAAILLDGERAGEQISFIDPYGDSSSGYIQALDAKVSSIIKADCELVIDYTPPNSRIYTDSTLLTGEGDYIVPAGVENIKVLIAQGGQGGRSGASGDTGWGYWGGISPGSEHGGDGGRAGKGGRWVQVELNVSPGDVIHYVCGLGGDSDEEGTDSIFGSYSSSAGVSTAGGFVDLFSGEHYGFPGIDGVKGGDSGQNVVYNGVTYLAGTKGADYQTGQGKAYGGDGGGSAVGGHGSNGYNGSWAEHGGVFYGLIGGDGGKGADAIINGEDATILACGGNGGHGGGCGGNAGSYYDPVGLPESREGYGGDGGKGSKGGKGGDGCIIVYT